MVNHLIVNQIAVDRALPLLKAIQSITAEALQTQIKEYALFAQDKQQRYLATLYYANLVEDVPFL